MLVSEEEAVFGRFRDFPFLASPSSDHNPLLLSFKRALVILVKYQIKNIKPCFIF
jgi:hypothetical protein